MIAIILTFFITRNLDSAVVLDDYEILTKIEYEDILTREQVRELVAQYPDWDVETMVDIAFCESSFRKEVVNYADSHRGCIGSYGLAQIGCLWVDDPEKLKDPEYNIKVAHDVWKIQSYSAWTCYARIK